MYVGTTPNNALTAPCQNSTGTAALKRITYEANHAATTAQLSNANTQSDSHDDFNRNMRKPPAKPGRLNLDCLKTKASRQQPRSGRSCIARPRLVAASTVSSSSIMPPRLNKYQIGPPFSPSPKKCHIWTSRKNEDTEQYRLSRAEICNSNASLVTRRIPPRDSTAKFGKNIRFPKASATSYTTT